MKESKVFFIMMLIAFAIVSCSKDKEGNFAQLIDRYGNPSAIQVDNEGGNVTCDEVAMNTGCSFGFTSGKIDYNGGEGGTFGPITWTTDGTYVNWTSSVPVNVAIIVKGGNNANVYFSGCGPEGATMGGTDLSASVNPRNGKPYGLSNITFCYNLSDMVIAFKSYMTEGWACTSGGPGNISFVGYYYFVPGHEGYKIYYTAGTTPATADLNKPVGNLTIADLNDDGKLEVKIDNLDRPDLFFTDAYLFVGKLADYSKNYKFYPLTTGVIDPVPSVTFELPF